MRRTLPGPNALGMRNFATVVTAAVTGTTGLAEKVKAPPRDHGGAFTFGRGYSPVILNLRLYS